MVIPIFDGRQVSSALVHGTSHCCVGLTLPPPAAKCLFIIQLALCEIMRKRIHQGGSAVVTTAGDPGSPSVVQRGL